MPASRSISRTVSVTFPHSVTDRIERHVVGVDGVLVAREYLGCPVAIGEHVLEDVVERARFVQFGGRDEIDGHLEGVRAVLDDGREVIAVGVTAAEGVRNVGVGCSEVAPQRARAHVAEIHEVALEVTQRPGELTKGVAVVAREHLPDIVAAFAEDLGDVVAPHDLVHVSKVGDPGGGDPALDDDRLVGRSVSGLDLCGHPGLDAVGDLVGPERVVDLIAPALVGLAFLLERIGTGRVVTRGSRPRVRAP